MMYLIAHWCMKEMLNRVSMQAGVAPGLLFNWALPLLRWRGNGGGGGSSDGSPREAAKVGSLFWVLATLREGLTACDERTLGRYAHALLQAAQALLEEESLSVHLLVPLLGVVALVGCCVLRS